jgi:predicted Zn-dependent protease
VLQDPPVNEYVEHVGQTLAHNSDALVPFTVKVIDSNEVAVFALPGGYLYVTTGMIQYADNESELAGVMAHAVAHVAARHAMRMRTREAIANIMTVPLIVPGDGGLKINAHDASGIALPLTFLRFARAYETEADYFGIQYLYQAGYDPEGFVHFLEKLEKEEPAKPSELARDFATHPPATERIKVTKKEIATILPRRDHSITDTPEFGQMKARLAAVQQDLQHGRKE